MAAAQKAPDRVSPSRNKAIGTIVRAWRKQAGFSLTQVAEMLGISAQIVSKYELGQVPMTVERLEQIAACFGKAVPAIYQGRSH